MLARVARAGRESQPPEARGFLGKARPPRVSRGLRRGLRAQPMDSGSTFPHRRRAAKTRGGDAGDMRVRVLDVPVPDARGGGSEALRREPRARGEASARTPRKAGLEKPLASAPPPVPKPTQVGWQRMPRRSGQPRSRNSAKWPRNFGRRVAPARGPQRMGPGDCLPKTQDSAQAERRRIGSDACPVPEGHAEGSAARRSSEAKPR